MTALTIAPVADRWSATYAERMLAAGDLSGGIVAGFTARPRSVVVRNARREYRAFRAEHGFAPDNDAPMLTKPEGQAKLGKSERYALGLMLTPADSLDRHRFGIARPVNVCPMASAGCRAACLSSSGRGAFDGVQDARQVRHAFLLLHPFAAGVLIGYEVARALASHGADGLTFRFNVVSDYRIERIIRPALELMIASGVRVYDYTAWAPHDRDDVPGYHLTYSAKESAHTSDAYLSDILRSGRNVAMAFSTRKGQALPGVVILRDAVGTPRMFEVIDGDVTDDRTTDPRANVATVGDRTVQGYGRVIGLRAKGDAGKADTSGFIRPVS